MKFIRSLPIFAVALFATASLHAQFLDTFSVNDSSNYNTVLLYQGSGLGMGPATFAINSALQFEPTAEENTTTAFFRNTGETLSDTSFGGSVSIDVDNAINGTVVGLAFATSPTGANTRDAVVDLTGGSGSNSRFTVGGTSLANITTDFTMGAVTETITRTGDTTFSFSLSGTGLTSGPVSGTFSNTDFTGSDVYFGMEVYGGFPGSGGTDAPTEDNLAFVPEPSTWVMGAAMLALVGVIRLRRVIHG